MLKDKVGAVFFMMVILGGSAPIEAGQALAGASGRVLENADSIESFAHCHLFNTTICLGVDEESETLFVPGESLAFSESAGIVIEESDDLSVMMASIEYIEDISYEGKPKELVAERQSIKGCSGRALQPHAVHHQ